MNRGLANSKRFVLVLGLLTGLVAFAIDISLPAIPPMVFDLATNMSLGQQVVGTFMAGLAVGQLPAGLLSDRYGRIPILYAGIGIFTIAGIATSVAGSIDTMLAARFVQGIGSASGLVLARAIVRDVASGAQAARLMTVLVMIFTAAPMLAPMFGSWLVTEFGWRMPFVAVTVIGVSLLYGINTALRETHVPNTEHHILRLLWNSVKEFFRHGESIYGMLIVLLTMTGIMGIVSGSAALIVEVFGHPVSRFGIIFALLGASILLGTVINRRLLLTFPSTTVIAFGGLLCGVVGSFLLWQSWQGDLTFWPIWAAASAFMVATAFIMPNATALALEPVPGIAGVAASIVGTIQSIAGASSAIFTSSLYDGSYLNVTTVLGVACLAVFALSMMRRLFYSHDPD